MKKIQIFLLALCLVAAFSVSGQKQMWDVGFTEMMISQNKQHYSDNVTAKNNQLVSQATVMEWKSVNDKMNNLVDSIDKWINKASIVLADAVSAYQLAVKWKDIFQVQGKIMSLVGQYPFATPIIIVPEEQIISDGEEFLALVYLYILTDGQANKMRVAERKRLYNEIVDQCQIILNKSKALYQVASTIRFQETFKTTMPTNILNQDKQIVSNLLKDLKF
ncbi:MAG: hypothetical protein JST58_04830 [Bacteroidetes bacterium]|nr:hypothetical protein [Bacteroidota bacterium]